MLKRAAAVGIAIALIGGYALRSGSALIGPAALPSPDSPQRTNGAVCQAISGFVYYDPNNNGILEGGENTRIAGNTIELRSSPTGTLIATTSTDSSGLTAAALARCFSISAFSAVRLR